MTTLDCAILVFNHNDSADIDMFPSEYVSLLGELTTTLATKKLELTVKELSGVWGDSTKLAHDQASDTGGALNRAAALAAHLKENPRMRPLVRHEIFRLLDVDLVTTVIQTLVVAESRANLAMSLFKKTQIMYFDDLYRAIVSLRDEWERLVTHVAPEISGIESAEEGEQISTVIFYIPGASDAESLSHVGEILRALLKACEDMARVMDAPGTLSLRHVESGSSLKLWVSGAKDVLATIKTFIEHHAHVELVRTEKSLNNLGLAVDLVERIETSTNMSEEHKWAFIDKTLESVGIVRESGLVTESQYEVLERRRQIESTETRLLTDETAESSDNIVFEETEEEPAEEEPA